MEQHVHTIFGVLGISFDSFTPVHMGFDEGADALISGDIDAQFQPPIPNRVMTDLSQRADVRVVPYAPGQLEKILSEVPFYRSVTMQKGVFRGVVEDITQPAVINVLVTHERISEEHRLRHGESDRQQSRHAAADESALQRIEGSL